MNLLKAKCGRVRSNKGKLFTGQSLKDHEASCRLCLYPLDDEFEEYNLQIAQMIADDLPDAAFWAIAHELGEW